MNLVCRIENGLKVLGRASHNFFTFSPFHLFAINLLLAASAFGGFTTTKQLVLQEGVTTELENGTIYQVGRDISCDFASKNYYGVAPITVKNGTTAVIYIPEGVELKLLGGNAAPAPEFYDVHNDIPKGNTDKELDAIEPTAAAAPAIRVEPDATLFITGHGTLRATGGKPANGAAGWAGKSGYSCSTGYNAGSGGAGGTGGGGGAAAIGGGGGKGGKGGEKQSTTFYSDHNGWGSNVESEAATMHGVGNKAGNTGANGGKGEDSGRVAVLGYGLKVITTVDTHYTDGGLSITNNPRQTASIYSVAGAIDDYSFGAGGSGGGGGGGGEAIYGIGGGAGGGGGGGGGASGTTVWSDNFSIRWGQDQNLWHCCGKGGGGGVGKHGTNDGVGGSGHTGVACACNPHEYRKIDSDKGVDRLPMAGGSGGQYGGDGAPGAIWLNADAQISAEGGNAYEKQPALISAATEEEWIHAAVVYTLSFVDSWEVSSTTKIFLGSPFPFHTPPSRAGFEFLGYFSGRNATGRQYYGSDGNYVGDDNHFAEFKDLTLYAAWGRLGEADRVTVKAGDHLSFDGRIDGEMVQPSDGRLFTIERGATLTLQNMTVLGNDAAKFGAIYNEGTLFVSNCVFSQVVAPNGWGGVYQDHPGAKAVFYACTFHRCSAHDSAAIAAEGSTVSLVHCTFYENLATSEQTGAEKAAVVSSTDGGKLNVISCTFLENETAVTDENLEGSAIITAADTDAEPVAWELYNNIIVTPSDNKLWGISGNLFERGAYDARSNLERGKQGGNYEEILAPLHKRVIDGVEHLVFRPINSARTQGLAGLVYRSPSWDVFTISPTGVASIPIDADQLRQHPLPGWAGACNGNTLQYLINDAQSGDTIEVAAGQYDPVVVDKKVTVIGAGTEVCTVDGDKVEPCVSVTANGRESIFAGFAFMNGSNPEGNGGGWQGPDGRGGIVSNCTFSACSAKYGGAVAAATLVVDCRIDSCEATEDGGGTYSCQAVERTAYEGNSAQNGGGAANDKLVRSSLFVGNKASKRGGGTYQTTLHNCTLASNSADEGDKYGAAFNTGLIACLLCNNNLLEGASDTFVVQKDVFADPANGDYHLRSVIVDAGSGERTRLTHESLRVRQNTTYIQDALNILDLDREALAAYRPGAVEGELPYLYAGCYAFMPFKAHGLMVTGTADYYDNTSTQTSLREAVEEARLFPQYAVDGELRITFDPAAFGSGTRSLNFSEPQIDIDSFTNTTLVIVAPTNCAVVIDGGERYRAFNVMPGNRLRVENLTFYRCWGATEGKTLMSTDGGAIQNHGCLTIANCVFIDNSAGSRTGEYSSKLGYGGAIATMDNATTTVWRATFVGNEAASGGALYTGKKARSDVFFSTFAENVALGGGGLGVDCSGGGAILSHEGRTAANETLLVNCTITANQGSPGGGIAAGKGLTLLNSVVVGNFSPGKNGLSTNDVQLLDYGEADFIATIYGVRNQPGNSANAPKYKEVASQGGCTVDQVFATDTVVTEDDLKRDVLVLTNGLEWGRSGVIPHFFIPLQVQQNYDDPNLFELTQPMTATNVFVAGDNQDIGFGGDKATAILRGIMPRLQRQGVRLENEQLDMHIDACIVGATRVTARRPYIIQSSGPGGGGEGEEVVENPVAKITYGDGKSKLYASVKEAIDAYQPGDTISLVREDDGSEEYWEDCDKLWDFVYGEVWSELGVMGAYVKDRPWLTLVGDETTMTFSMELNEQALPTVSLDLSAAGGPGGIVSVSIENLKPDLWYALGSSTDLGESFTIVSGKWVQAKLQLDGSVKLTEKLTAPAELASGFYRVFVSAGKR